MRIYFLSLILMFNPAMASDLGPQLSPNDNLCPDELIHEVTSSGQGRINVIKALIAKTSKGNPNCYQRNQGITLLSYLAESHHNETLLDVIEQLQPDLDF